MITVILFDELDSLTFGLLQEVIDSSAIISKAAIITGNITFVTLFVVLDFMVSPDFKIGLNICGNKNE